MSWFVDALSACGVRRVWGPALDALPDDVWGMRLPVAERVAAACLADADGALGPFGMARAGVAHLGDGRFRFSSAPGAEASMTFTVHDADVGAAVVAEAAALVCGPQPSAVEVVLDCDPSSPSASTSVGARRGVRLQPTWTEPDEAVVAVLRGAQRPVVLAGPGVVRAGPAAVAGLAALAAAANVGVVNTWGAKGVFDWRSRHHLVTAGLQAWDFDRCGFADADRIVAVGVDRAEAPDGLWRLAPVSEIGPDELAPLAEVWHRPAEPIADVALWSVLREATLGWWALPVGDAPDAARHPAQWTRDLAASTGPEDLVVADPGDAGLWVARTFPTRHVGSVRVPSSAAAHGFAAAAALVRAADAPHTTTLALVDDPTRPETEAVVDAAASLGVAVTLSQWGGERLALRDGATAELEAIAGPVVAWRRA